MMRDKYALEMKKFQDPDIELYDAMHPLTRAWKNYDQVC
jgi:hypothetical protein